MADKKQSILTFHTSHPEFQPSYVCTENLEALTANCCLIKF